MFQTTVLFVINLSCLNTIFCLLRGSFMSFDNQIHNEFLPDFDYFDKKWAQYWRPYIGVHDKNLVNLVKINKFNINNYMLDTDLKYKIYKILKMYNNK